MFRNPQLANTYDRLAREGRDGFYQGETARVIADYMKKQGGFLSEQDLAAHHSEWVEPVSVDYRGYRVWELPPNGQGIAALQILKILEGFDLAAAGFGSADYLHLLVEAKKLAFEDRARFYADPDFYQTPVAALLSDEYAKQRRELIELDHAARTASHGDPQALESGDTIYLTVADAQGNMVSLIQSNYSGMGSGMTPPGTGFHPAKSWRIVQSRKRPSQCLRTGQTTLSYHHSGLCYPGRQALVEFRRHGWRHAAPGSCADPGQPHRLRDEPAAGR